MRGAQILLLSPHHTTHKGYACASFCQCTHRPLAWYASLTLATCGRELLILERKLKGYAMYLVSVRPSCAWSWCTHIKSAPHHTQGTHVQASANALIEQACLFHALCRELVIIYWRRCKVKPIHVINVCSRIVSVTVVHGRGAKYIK